MRHSMRFALSVTSMALIAGCTGGKKTGFALEDAPIRFVSADLGDPALLAEVNGIKVTKAQILDKSQVIKDLDRLTNDFLIGQAYLKVVEKWQLNRGASASVVEEAPAAAKVETEKVEVRHGRTRPAAPAAPRASGAVVKIFLPESETPLKDILIRFDRQPVAGLGIEYATTEDANLLAEGRGVRVTRDDVEMQHGLMQSIEQRRYLETMSQMQQQLARILVNAEAEKQGSNLQDFVNQKILAGKNFDSTTA